MLEHLEGHCPSLRQIYVINHPDEHKQAFPPPQRDARLFQKVDFPSTPEFRPFQHIVGGTEVIYYIPVLANNAGPVESTPTSENVLATSLKNAKTLVSEFNQVAPSLGGRTQNTHPRALHFYGEN